MQENIELLLQIEESKRKNVEDLKQREQEAHARTEQATVEKQQVETALAGKQSELQKVKGELKTEKFKGAAAEAGSIIMDGISSALGTPKVKRYEQENAQLRTENLRLTQAIERQQDDHRKEVRAINEEYRQEVRELKDTLGQIFDYFPKMDNILKLSKFAESIGFPKDIVRDMASGKTIRFSGQLYSNEFSQRFRANESPACFDKDPSYPDRLTLMIDNKDFVYWFRDKYKEGMKAIGIDLDEIERKQNQNKSRSI